MATEEEVQEQKGLLETYRRTLQIYLRQQARLGEAHLPPGTIHGIDEARDLIRRIKEVLRQWGKDIEDHPDDEEQTSEVFVRRPRITIRADIATYYFSNNHSIIMDEDASLFVISIANADSRPAHISSIGFTVSIDGESKTYSILNILADPVLDKVNPKLNTAIESGRKLDYYYRLGLLVELLKQGEEVVITEVIAHDEIGNKYIGRLTDALQQELLRHKKQ